MTARESMALIGREGLLHVSRLMSVAVRIVDVKQVYGCTRYLVEPMIGAGQEWVDAARVRVDAR